jgi:hypothetical protein
MPLLPQRAYRPAALRLPCCQIALTPKQVSDPQQTTRPCPLLRKSAHAEVHATTCGANAMVAAGGVTAPPAASGRFAEGGTEVQWTARHQGERNVRKLRFPAIARGRFGLCATSFEREPERFAGENPPMQVHALTSSQCLYETLDLFLTREAAEAELREILEDEPDWKTCSVWCRSSSTGGTCRRTSSCDGFLSPRPCSSPC